MRVSARGVAAIGTVGLLLGNVGRIPGAAFGGRTAPLVAIDLSMLFMWFVLLLVLVAGRVRVIIDDVMASAALFVGVSAISTALAFTRYNLGMTDGIAVTSFLARWVAYFGWYLFVVWCLTREESQLVWRDLELALLAFAVFGIFQSAFLPGFAQMIHEGSELPTWDIQGRRLVSTILDPNFAGIVIVIALLFRLARVAQGIQENMAAMITLGAALLLTVSRSAFAGLGVGIAVLIVSSSNRRRLFAVLGAGALVALPFLSLLLAFAAGFNKLSYDMSAAQRLVPWTRAIRLIIEHPWLGVGFNAIRQAQESHQWRAIGGADVSLDGGLLFVAAMTGLVGVSVYLLMVSKAWRGARRVWRDSLATPDDRAHATATAAATVAVIAHSFFVNSLLLPFVMQIVWVMWGRLAHIRAARRARLGLAVAVPLIFAAAGCDPCAGTATCSTPQRVTLSGTIVDHATGVGVKGAHIDVQLSSTSGGAFKATASAVTDDEGLWQVSADGFGQSEVAAHVTVTAPNRTPYTANITVPVSTRAGDATVVGLWSDEPFAKHLATLVHASVPLAGAEVSFTRTSGAAVTSPHVDGATNAAGIFELDLAGSQVAPVVGTLTITHPSLTHPIVLSGYSIPLDYQFGIPAPQSTIPVGGMLAYGGQVVFRGTGEKVANVGVDFVRTGGIATTPDHVSATTDSTGFFRIDLTPVGDGDVIGDLTLRPPGLPSTTYKNVHLATYDSLFIRSSGVWAFGQAWSWAIELWRNDSLVPAPGVGVKFVRTGGVSIGSATIETLEKTTDGRIVRLVTGADGRVPLYAPVRDTGFVDGDLFVFPPTGPPRFVTSLHLHTNADDQLHFAGVYTFGPALRYVGEVLTTGGAPVVGAQVQWTQTSGIAATPAVLSSVTDASGRFSLRLYPSTDGVAIGQVVVHPPAPWAAGTQFTFNNLQLPTFLTADLRLAVTYRIAPP